LFVETVDFGCSFLAIDLFGDVFTGASYLNSSPNPKLMLTLSLTLGMTIVNPNLG